MSSANDRRGRVRGFLLAGLLCVVIPGVCRAVTAGTEVTDRRLALLRQLTQEELARQGLEAAETDISEAVLARFLEQEPSCPSAEPLAARWIWWTWRC